MKNIIIGIAISSIAFAGIAAAKTTAIEVKTTGIVLVNYSDDGKIAKYYDYNNGATCYWTVGATTVEISCIK